MITIAMSTVVGASRQQVWRALTAPAERLGWDERLLAPIDGVEDYPRAGCLVRWRYRLGSVHVVMEDQPLEVVPGERLRSHLAFGHLRIDEIWTLADENGSGEQRTRLALRLVASNSVSLVGGLLDRFSLREVAAEIADGRLRLLQKWCETRP